MIVKVADCKIKDIMKAAEEVVFEKSGEVKVSWRAKNDFVFLATYNLDSELEYTGTSEVIEGTFGAMTLNELSKITSRLYTSDSDLIYNQCFVTPKDIDYREGRHSFDKPLKLILE